ncbi:lysosomal alpha-mannosidase-like [Drosophila tropicalis]|uniref:lysosomal alpha-mannosidase-like n=1 Tax=Drosophila tropicalis TaxID=46794 RepID=UPI0035ABBFFF
MKYFSVLLFTWAVLLSSSIIGSDAGCGFESCPALRQDMINVHLVPHSHDDVGWLKTFDQYYYGAENQIQHAGVQYILDSVVQELLKDSNRRFIQVETSFFFKWFNEQSETIKLAVNKLVENGQLEFTGGGWSMNDEAAAHYQSIIDQFSVGLKYLSDSFGACGRPNIGWQIDPFGHSREMASIFAQMGFSGEFFARIDYIDKRKRMDDLSMEMIWQSSESLSNSDFFAGSLYGHYSAPGGYCFDVHCGDDPIIDGDSFDNNVRSRVNDFLSHITTVSKAYRTNHVMVPMGDDFQYENAEVNFKNMDKLIKYVNARQTEGSRVHLLYSTPGCYLKALHQLEQTWPNKTQDFFPYSSDSHAYWTGYFTSRPTQKRFERDGNHFLQVVKQLSTFANLTTTQHTSPLNTLRQTMGVMQHHDAITGTEKQTVARDYDRLLTDAIVGAETNARDALRILTNLTTGEFSSCLELNISVCALTQESANNLVVTLFNPLAHTSTQYVRVPVKDKNYVIADEKGREVSFELVPVPSEVLDLGHRANVTQHELVFKASVEKIASFYIRILPTPRSQVDRSGLSRGSYSKKWSPPYYALSDENDLEIQNSLIKLVFDNSTGRLKTVVMNGVTANIEQTFALYQGFLGNNGEEKNRSSGAYVFRPDGDIKELSDKIDLTVYNGDRVQEVHQHVNEWISQVIRLYDGVNRVEFEWLVGPIPVDDNTSKEIVTRFKSDISSNGVFYTDSNGREMLERKRNERENFDPDLTEEISANYYPVTTRISLQDEKKRMTLLNDRAQGGSSQEDGVLELMIHRRLLSDDNFGVGEALNEEQFGTGLVARGKVFLIVNYVSEKPTRAERLTQEEIHLPFWKFFSKSNSVASVLPNKLPDFTDLPQSINLLTLEPYSSDEILLRFEHVMDHTESNVLSFNIRTIFDTLAGKEIRETTLDGNLPLSEMKRLKFHHDVDGTDPSKVEYFTASHKPLSANASMANSEFSVTLYPMQIRTFIIKR